MAGAWRLKKGVLVTAAALAGRGGWVASAGGAVVAGCAGGAAMEADALRRDGL